ncbi:hypothetical protein QQF64_008668, partial [Cirrhinus molitorella]
LRASSSVAPPLISAHRFVFVPSKDRTALFIPPSADAPPLPQCLSLVQAVLEDLMLSCRRVSLSCFLFRPGLDGLTHLPGFIDVYLVPVPSELI